MSGSDKDNESDIINDFELTISEDKNQTFEYLDKIELSQQDFETVIKLQKIESVEDGDEADDDKTSGIPQNPYISASVASPVIHEVTSSPAKSIPLYSRNPTFLFGKRKLSAR